MHKSKANNKKIAIRLLIYGTKLETLMQQRPKRETGKRNKKRKLDIGYLCKGREKLLLLFCQYNDWLLFSFFTFHTCEIKNKKMCTKA